MPDEQRRDIRLTLRPLASDWPAPIRLKRLLKAALRAWGFRCVCVEELPAAEYLKARVQDLATQPSDRGLSAAAGANTPVAAGAGKPTAAMPGGSPANDDTPRRAEPQPKHQAGL
jgi:hypothetical protein